MTEIAQPAEAAKPPAPIPDGPDRPLREPGVASVFCMRLSPASGAESARLNQARATAQDMVQRHCGNLLNMMPPGVLTRWALPGQIERGAIALAVAAAVGGYPAQCRRARNCGAKWTPTGRRRVRQEAAGG